MVGAGNAITLWTALNAVAAATDNVTSLSRFNLQNSAVKRCQSDLGYATGMSAVSAALSLEFITFICMRAIKAAIKMTVL